jgi:hypothetical protein
MSTDEPSAQPSLRTDLDPLVKFLLARLDDDEDGRAGPHARRGDPPVRVDRAGRRPRGAPRPAARAPGGRREAVHGADVAEPVRTCSEIDRGGRPDVAAAMVVAMAAVFAEHPDFDPGWLGALGKPG